MGQITVDNLKRLKNQEKGYENIGIFVETGTFKGVQTNRASFVFDKVFGIELSEHWHGVTSEKNKDRPNVTMILGNTSVELPKLLAEHSDTPLFIYLDAHFCKTDPPIEKSEFPLWEELALIKARNQKEIVIVDDVHTFGKNRTDLKIDQEVEEWENITCENLLEFFGERVFHSEIVDDSFVIWLK
jgi:hypothetical protein